MRLGLVAAVCALAMLPACVESHQTIDVSQDGNAKVTWELAVDAALVGMSQANGEAAFCNENLKLSPPEGVSAFVKRSTRKGDIVCTITATGKTEKLLSALGSGVAIPGDKEGKSKDFSFVFSEGNGFKRLDLNLMPLGGPDLKDDKMTSMFLAATSGRYMEWTVSAPLIVSTNGKMSDDKKTATFSIPVATMMTNKSDTYSFYVVFQDSPPSLWHKVRSWFN